MSNLKIGIVLSTVREKRVADEVAKWVKSNAQALSNDLYEIIDLRDYSMCFYGNKEITPTINDFNDKLRQYDGYLFVLAEYNHSIPGVLKNALDCVTDSMANKAAGIISYGAVGGARAAEHLRNILSQLSVAHVSRQVLFNIYLDFEAFTKFRPQELHNPAFKDLLANVLTWSKAFKTIRQ